MCISKDFIKMFCKFKLEMQITMKAFGITFDLNIIRISQVSGCFERIS